MRAGHRAGACAVDAKEGSGRFARPDQDRALSSRDAALIQTLPPG